MSLSAARERRAAVDAYIEEGRQKQERTITQADIWRAAGYKSRTTFERWLRNDPARPNKTADPDSQRSPREAPPEEDLNQFPRVRTRADAFARLAHAMRVARYFSWKANNGRPRKRSQMTITHWPIGKFVPSFVIPARHQAWTMMAASIQEFGFKIPYLAL